MVVMELAAQVAASKATTPMVQQAQQELVVAAVVHRAVHSLAVTVPPAQFTHRQVIVPQQDPVAVVAVPGTLVQQAVWVDCMVAGAAVL
jgi:3-dehydroquinate dehydratase